MMGDGLRGTAAGEAPLSSARVVVAIPTLNEGPNIGAVLESFLSAPQTFGALWIVVADGGSKDGTVAIVEAFARRHPSVSVMANPRRIQSAGVNMVAQAWASRADILVRCDAHSIYPQGYVAAVVSRLLSVGAQSVVVPMDSRGASTIGQAVALASNSAIGTGGSAHRGGRKSGFVDHGHHAAFDLASFLSVGGYDETFTHNEDAEFDNRLALAGGKVFLDADARIGYITRGTLKGLWRQYFNYGWGRARTVRRHPRSLRARQLLVPGHVVFSLICILLAVVSGRGIFLAWPILYVLILAAASVREWLKERTLSAALIGFAAAVMHTAWGLGFVCGFLFAPRSKWPAPLARQAP